MLLYTMSTISKYNNYPETVIFLGAGATAAAEMPPTYDQADFLFRLCDVAITPNKINTECLKNHKKDICNLLNLLDFKENKRFILTTKQKKLLGKAFPKIPYEEAEYRVLSLRNVFDWPALKYVAIAQKKTASEMPETYLQSVYNMFDVHLREERGYLTSNQKIFLPVSRLRAGREMMILLTNIMFSCAYENFLKDKKTILDQYRQFADRLADLMSKEAFQLSKDGHVFNQRSFYLFSYAIVTTNFEPLYLWLIFQAHRKFNQKKDIFRSTGQILNLFLDFPITIGMRSPAEDTENLSDLKDFTLPYTEAVVQKINNPNYSNNRIIRTGKYYFLHGSSNFRHCPRCGRVFFFLGNKWNENEALPFPPSIMKPFTWNITPRTKKEDEARKHGDYDALECMFCGCLTHSQDNFMHMQTQLKGSSPSFIKEISDEALAMLSHAKHIVLLGYSLPPDDAIWSNVLSALAARPKGQEVYCSVICGYGGEDKWLYNKDLEAYINQKYASLEDEYKKARGKTRDSILQANGVIPIRNAINVFGREYVRAYVGGIPQVFNNGDLDTVRELLYPHKAPWDKIQCFDENGVVRK